MKNPLIPAGGKFPVNASELRLVKYVAVGTLEKTEKEEAAVRLLLFSQQNGEYVGVGWNDVMLQWAEEAEESEKQNKLRQSHYEAESIAIDNYSKQRKVYMAQAFCTLGVSLLFTKKPVAPEKNDLPASKPAPFSISLLFRDPQRLINAFWDLINEGLVIKENHNEIDYFIPTPALVGKILLAK